MKSVELLGLSLTLLGSLGLGCADPAPSSAPPLAQAEETEGDPPAEPASERPTTERKAEGAAAGLHAHMQEHFVRVDEMRLALVRGELDEAKSLAKWLAEHPPHDDLPKGWEPYVEMMRDQSRKVMEEQTLAEAALDAARVAGTCGSCHVANRAKVHLGAAPEPEDQAPLEHHMWAAERLWDGVVSQSDELWTAGTASLKEASVLPPGLKTPPPGLAKAKAAFAKLQAAAEEAKTPNARVEVLGAYLGQCQGCHVQAKQALDAL